MTLPNFLIIGAQKAGTTWLAKHLQSHVDVFLYDKEIHYFDSRKRFDNGLQWYESHFDGVTEEIAVGEKTPEYLWIHTNPDLTHVPEVHKRIYETLPDAKLIMILRNPVERAISSLVHTYRKKYISPLYGPDAYLTGRRRRLGSRHGIIEKGFYYHHIQAYRDYYPADQMLILIYEEDVAQYPEAGMRKVCRFLGVDETFSFKGLEKKVHGSRENRLGIFLEYYFPFLHPLTARMNCLSGIPKLRPSEKVIDELYEIYKEPNEKLYKLLGRRIDAWTRKK